MRKVTYFHDKTEGDKTIAELQAAADRGEFVNTIRVFEEERYERGGEVYYNGDMSFTQSLNSPVKGGDPIFESYLGTKLTEELARKLHPEMFDRKFAEPEF